VSTVTYRANGSNGGAVPVDPTVYAAGDVVAVLPNGLTKRGFLSSGWNTKANSTGTRYVGGSAFSIGSTDVILYAAWVSNSTLSPPPLKSPMHPSAPSLTRPWETWFNELNKKLSQQSVQIAATSTSLGPAGPAGPVGPKGDPGNANLPPDKLGFLHDDGTGVLAWLDPDANIDGGAAYTVYTAWQHIDGGNAYGI